MVAAAIFGIPRANRLSPTGFEDPTAESAIATHLLADKFSQGDQQLLIIVSSADGARSAAASKAAPDIVDRLQRSPHVASVTSAWTSSPAAAAQMISEDSSSGLIVAGITGGERAAPKYAETLSEQLTNEDYPGVTVRSGGPAMVNSQITR